MMPGFINHFQQPWLLLLLVLVPVYTWLQIRASRVPASVLYSGLDVARGIAPSFRQRVKSLFPWSRSLVLALGIVALARPQFGTVEFSTNTLGVDISMIIDVSGSMQEQDYRPNRLEAAKSAAANFVSNRKTDRVNVVVFGENAALLCPPTLDMNAAKQFIEAISPNIIRNQSTAVGDGLATGVKKLQDSTAKSKVAILLTDGDSNSGKIQPAQAAEIARSLGVRVYTIGVGRNQGAQQGGLSILGGMAPAQQYYAGFDENVLEEIAKITGGKYYRATNENTLKNIYAEIDRLEKSEIEVDQVADFNERFMFFWFPALALLAFELLLRAMWLRRIP